MKTNDSSSDFVNSMRDALKNQNSTPSLSCKNVGGGPVHHYSSL